MQKYTRSVCHNERFKILPRGIYFADKSTGVIMKRILQAVCLSFYSFFLHSADNNELFRAAPECSLLPAKLCNLFDQHDTQKIAHLVHSYEMETHIFHYRQFDLIVLSTSTRIATRSSTITYYSMIANLYCPHATNEIDIRYADKPDTAQKFGAVAEFLKDAWN